MKDRDAAPPKNPARAAREKRLAEALRANLRRRKAVPEPRPSDIAAGTPDNGPESGGGRKEGG